MYASRAKISPDARRHSRKLRNEAQDLPKAHHCIPDRPASPELPSTHPSAQHNTMQPTQPLQRALRRLALTTKMVNKGFYKGNRTGSMGTHTKWGGYTIDYKKVRTYMVPNLENCMLTPFVTKLVKPPMPKYFGKDKNPMNGESYLRRWKKSGGNL
ncbi:60S ribosomal protein L27, mitochondrial [Zalaria obscura]|uniref:60S ribosomal protein L27, mitochondrial n=1 Tax=Zalaria obscura TaxID=2024903 RepID=A0ACC3SIN0_9PEZI